MIDLESTKQEFLTIFSQIKREGADRLKDYLLNTSDFFTAPASGRRHSNFDGGLCLHSINVYKRLKKLVISEYGQDYTQTISDESLAIIGLLHDVCKVNTYTKDLRNKKENGQWVQVPYYSYSNNLPYGHGEKSVYMLSSFIRLSREEAMSINWHMGGYDPRSLFSTDLQSCFSKYPIALFTHIADLQATYLDEQIIEN